LLRCCLLFIEHSMFYLSSEIDEFYHKVRPSPAQTEQKASLITFIDESVTYLYTTLTNELEGEQGEDEEDAYFDYEKERFLQHLETQIRCAKAKSQYRKGKPWDTFVFGSEAWNISSWDSDTDIAIRLDFRNGRNDKIFLLRSLSRILSENDRNSLLHVQFIEAKYPIIRISHIEHAYIQIDVSIADRYCAIRTELIDKILNHYEVKFGLPMRRLIVFIKHWSKCRGINNSYKCYLNSYAYVLLIIKFVQHLLAENKHIIWYNKSLSHLAFEFFEYYLFKYDISKQRVCIANPFDTLLPEQRQNNSKAILELIDPVNVGNNVADKVGFAQFDHIRAEFIRSFSLFAQFMTEEITQISLFDVLCEYPVSTSQYGSSEETNCYEIVGETEEKLENENDHQS